MGAEELKAGAAGLKEGLRLVSSGLLPGISVIPAVQAARLHRLARRLDELESSISGIESSISALCKKAREDGLAAGREDAASEAGALISGLKCAADSIVSETSADAIDLAFLLAKKIVRREIDSDPDILIEEVEAWKRSRAGRSLITIRAHASDAITLRVSGVEGVTVLDDGALEPGAFLVEAGGSRVLSGPVAALERLKDEL